MIKIALVDDHVVLRKSLGILIEMLSDFKIVLEADNGQDFIKQFKKTKNTPDIVLMDLTMPAMDGIETAQWLKQFHPHIKILALSMIKNEIMVIRMLKNGARGYILKDCEPSELKTALLEIHYNGYYYNQFLTLKMQKELAPGKIILSCQELSFLRWACTELTHKQIADEMQVSPRTVDGYRDALFRKLEVNSRVGIAIYAIKNGLVQV